MDKYLSCEFTVPGIPVGKGRPRVTMHGTYTPKKTKEYEQRVRDCWRTQSGAHFDAGQAIRAEINAWFPIPKSTPKKRAACMDGTFHLKKPDSDNIAKAILDSLNGLAYPDDSAVQLGPVDKRYTNGAPRVEVKIHVIE